MNILFGSGHKKRITQRELDETLVKASSMLDDREKDEVKLAFGAALDPEHLQQAGISRAEKDAGMEHLRAHGSLEDHELDRLDAHFEKHLKD